MKPIIICKDCKEEKTHEARGMCLNCYARWKWHNVIDKEKQKKRQYKWRKENKEEYNTKMRLIMRKRTNVQYQTKFTAQELVNMI